MRRRSRSRSRGCAGGTELSFRGPESDYDAYIPDALTGRSFAFDGDVAADIADAEAAVSRMDAQTPALVDAEALARILLRAMTYGVERVGAGDQITVELLLEIHRRLLADTPLDQYAGRMREVQNWIGGSDYNPCAAAYVPPPPEYVPGLLADLCAFCNGTDLPAIAQAAIAHAQFETIHPFVDGNGRAGRTVIHLVLRRRGLALRVLPPVSLVLAAWTRSYVDGLTQYRHTGSPTSPKAMAAVNTWAARFAAACTRCASDAAVFQARATDLEAQWRTRLGKVRANSATDILLRVLPGAPILTIHSAETLLNRTFKPTHAALHRLIDAGVLQEITLAKRSLAYEAPEIIDAFTALERQLASSPGDTRASPPARPVPYRRIQRA